MRFSPFDQSVMLQSSSWRWKRPCWHDLRVRWKSLSSERQIAYPSPNTLMPFAALRNSSGMIFLASDVETCFSSLSPIAGTFPSGRMIHRKNGTDFFNCSRCVWISGWLFFWRTFVKDLWILMIIPWWYDGEFSTWTPSDVNEYSNSLFNLLSAVCSQTSLRSSLSGR